MSIALGHFAFGSAMTVLVVAYLVPDVPYPRLVALLGGGWAMVPDVSWISPVFAAELRQYHDTWIADVFWLHGTMDALDPSDSNVAAAAMVAFLIVATALAERRAYRTPEAVAETIERTLGD
jgi:hypothetical protein